ncbi:hypothetical protein [Nocardia spumae]|uniref:hypothetical protein n=1 Tax=Nocardia spumae TaxID=2887190 RepID=UPI001D14F1DC|nr:hypothetical protein [Nocardia spumae]
MSLERELAEAPEILRPAIVSFASTAHAQLMFSLLKLGSAETGFPRVEWWDYSRHGLTVDVLMRGGQTLADWTNDDTRSRIADHVGVQQVTASLCLLRAGCGWNSAFTTTLAGIGHQPHHHGGLPVRPGKRVPVGFAGRRDAVGCCESLYTHSSS